LTYFYYFSRAKLKKEEEAAARAKQIEEESKLSGVAGMRAFFFRQAESTQDATKTNEETIKEEYARRKALREAKAKAAEAALDASRNKSPEEIPEDDYKNARRQSMARQASDKQLKESEKAERAARIKALNEKWGVGNSAKSP
jgi:hypothetical protein